MKKILLHSLAKKTHRMSSSQTRLQRPCSTASLSFPKGLTNPPGENNCFLNSAVQVLWHLDVFRRSFRSYIGHACMGNSCIFCALKVIFTQFQYGEEEALPPDALRYALAENFKNEQRFQLGHMDDAAECFENILCRIHFHVAHDIKEDLCSVEHCVPHRKFGMTLVENSKCRCGATSEPFPFTQMVNYVSCKALCSEYRKNKIRREPRSLSFGKLLHLANAVGDIRDCPSNCGKKIEIQRVVTNSPEVVSVGLVWDSDRPSVDHIMDVIKCLGTTIMLEDIFYKVLDNKTKSTKFILVGVVTYYGKHYSTFFYNTKFRMWIYFDDASVKKVGPNWRDVVERCRKGHYQPLLLIFADQNGHPVSMETAPKNTIRVTGPPDLNDADTSDGHEPEVFSHDSRPLPVNHNHYNSTSSSTSTHSYKSFTSFDSNNTVIYKPSAEELRALRTPSVVDNRPPKPARSNSSEMFRQIQPIPEFRPQVQSVDRNGSYNERTATANQNWGVVEIGHDARKLATEAMAYPSMEYYRNEERKRLEEYANLKRERDSHKAEADELISTLQSQSTTSNIYTPKFPVSKDLIDFTQDEKTSRKVGDGQRTSGEYDDQYTWMEGLNASPVSTVTQTAGNLLTSTLGSKPRRQPSFQYAVGASTPNAVTKSDGAGPAGNHNVKQMRRPQSAMTRTEPLSSNFKDGQGRDSQRAVSGGRPQSAMTRTEPLSSNYKDYHSSDGQRAVIGGRPQSARSSEAQHLYTTSVRLQTQRSAGTDSAVSNSSQPPKPLEHRRSLVSSMSVPDLSEKLSQTSTKIPVTNNGYREDGEIGQWSSQRRSQFGSQPHLNVDKPDSNSTNERTVNYSKEMSSTRNEDIVKATNSKMPKYRSAPNMQHTTVRTTSTNSYTLQSGFVTLPRKRQSANSQKVPMRADHISDMVVKGNHPISQKPDFYDKVSIGGPQQVSATLTSGVLDQFHQTHLGYTGVLPVPLPKSDALEVGSLGRDSGYRSGDRNSTSSGSIYSIDMLGDYQSSHGSPNQQPRPSYVVEMSETTAMYAKNTDDTSKPAKQTWGDLVYEANKLLKKSRVAEDSDDLAAALSMITNSIMHIKQALKDSDLDPQTRVLLENLYQSTVSRSRSIHNCLQILQRQDSNHSTSGEDDFSLPQDSKLSNQFQRMSLSHSKTFPNPTQHQSSERYSTSDHHQEYTQTNTNAYSPVNQLQVMNSFLEHNPQKRFAKPNDYALVSSQAQGLGRYETGEPVKRYSQDSSASGYSQVASVCPANTKQYISTSASLQTDPSTQTNYPQYSRDLKSEVNKLDYSQQSVKYTQSQHHYRADSRVKGKEVPQYASAATPPIRPPVASLQQTRDEEFLDGHTGRRQSVKDKISMFESPQLNRGQTELKSHYTAQDLYSPHSRSAREFPQEQTFKAENRTVRRNQTMPTSTRWTTDRR